MENAYEYDLDACEHIRLKPHECPYRSELFNDFTLCSCCDKCIQQCNEDI